MGHKHWAQIDDNVSLVIKPFGCASTGDPTSVDWHSSSAVTIKPGAH